MKNLKYSSVISAFAAVILSVFLFTSCEKDTAVSPQSNKGDLIEKFKRLKFQTVTTTKGNASGNFVGAGDNDINFVEPNIEAGPAFADDMGSNNSFTDPMSSSSSFSVNGSFGVGGGSFNLNGETHTISFGFCGTDLFEDLDLSEDQLEEVDIFIGISGEFNFEDLEDSTSDGSITHMVFAISYNGGTELTNLEEVSEEDDLDGLAFVMVMEFVDGEFKAYMSTGGSIDFSETYMNLSNVSLVDERGMDAGSMDANFECVNYEEFETSM